MDFLIAVVLLLIWGVPAYLKRKAKKEAATTIKKNFSRLDETPVDAAYRPAPPQYSAAPRRPMPPPDVPDAACVVCDNTGEDHFAHDKAQRIAQLDDFLKNGIIDKAEYRTLRDRYERNL